MPKLELTDEERKARKAARNAAYNAKPENKARRAELRATPEHKSKYEAYMIAYRNDPINKERSKINCKLWRSKPENKARSLGYDKSWYSRNKSVVSAKRAKKRLSNEEYRAKEDARREAWAATPIGKAKSLTNSARQRAIKFGLDFDMDFSDILQALQDGKCQATGAALDFSRPSNGRSRNYNTPSLDRIDCSRGYTKDNIRIVAWIYNAAKGDGTEKEFISFMRENSMFNHAQT